MTGAPPAGDPGIGRLAGLAAWLDAQAPGSTHEVAAVERPAAGYSSETALVDVADGVRIKIQKYQITSLMPKGTMKGA